MWVTHFDVTEQEFSLEYIIRDGIIFYVSGDLKIANENGNSVFY